MTTPTMMRARSEERNSKTKALVWRVAQSAKTTLRDTNLARVGGPVHRDEGGLSGQEMGAWAHEEAGHPLQPPSWTSSGCRASHGSCPALAHQASTMTSGPRYTNVCCRRLSPSISAPLCWCGRLTGGGSSFIRLKMLTRQGRLPLAAVAGPSSLPGPRLGSGAGARALVVAGAGPGLP